MKINLTAFIAGGLMLAGTSTVSYAGNEGQIGTGSASDEVAFCKGLVPGTFASVGECVSYVRTAYVEACESIKDAGLFPYDVGGGTVLKNKGDCVSYTRHFGT